MSTVSSFVRTLGVAGLLLGSVAAQGAPGQDGDVPVTSAVDDVVVVALIDSGFAPYHDDFRADLMPQHEDSDPGNNLPLDRDPSTWLPGFDPEAFASYERLPLTLPERYDSVPMEQSYADDADLWADAQTSTRDGGVHASWVPGTKIIAGLSFDSSGAAFAEPSGASHGVGTSSVSVGNIHGTCPQCLVVLIRYDGADSGEAALDWAFSQPWIDVVSNWFGAGTVPRDQTYFGSDSFLQSQAVTRGQAIVWSAGNGRANAFAVPAFTTTSSQKGGDWTITVGAIAPNGGSFSGSNKPVDIAAPGTSYPSAPSSGTGMRNDSASTFSGTSNAAPVIAGTYARALHEARRLLDGPSRVQDDGIIAVGAPVECGPFRPDCELGDGVLTGLELRTRLLHGGIHTEQGYVVAVGPSTPNAGPEHEFMSEGHGSYFGHLGDVEEEHLRVLEPMVGLRPALERPDGELEWMIVDSYCRQRLWGRWEEGYWRSGDPLPAADAAWPMRESYLHGCSLVPEDGI